MRQIFRGSCLGSCSGCNLFEEYFFELADFFDGVFMTGVFFLKDDSIDWSQCRQLPLGSCPQEKIYVDFRQWIARNKFVVFCQTRKGSPGPRPGEPARPSLSHSNRFTLLDSGCRRLRHRRDAQAQSTLLQIVTIRPNFFEPFLFVAWFIFGFIGWFFLSRLIKLGGESPRLRNKTKRTSIRGHPLFDLLWYLPTPQKFPNLNSYHRLVGIFLSQSKPVRQLEWCVALVPHHGERRKQEVMSR